MKFPVAPAPHWLGAMSVPAMMRQVLYALLPVIVVSTWLFGSGVLLNIVWACVCCLGLEYAMLLMRGQPVSRYLNDGSAVVTALLMALALPPLTPWWVTAAACLFAIVFAKHVYGGLGYNPFNPAMVGYVVVLVSFPVELAHWPGPGTAAADVGLTLRSFFAGLGTPLPDALSGATPLDEIRIGLAQKLMLGEILIPEHYGWLAGVQWQWINLAALAGGGWLLHKQVIRWHAPVAMLASLGLLTTIAWSFSPDTQPGPMLNLFSGGTMLTAFFIVTDPVSGATSDRGKLFFGAGVGAVTFAIRQWGAYPDGLAFAVLLMNVCAPLIDRYTLPRVYGHEDRP